MKKIINTDLAPKPVGPYSQAVQVGNFLFISGQLGIDPETEELEMELEDQVHQIIKNIISIVEKAGGQKEDIVKTTIFLLDIDDFEEVNAIYEDYFTNNSPARSCLEAVLPKEALVEIEAIAIIPPKKTS